MKQTSLKRSLLFSKKSSIGHPSLGPSQPLHSASGPTFLASFNPKKPCQLLFSKQASLVHLFIFLQILQTVVPIIPGALTSVAGVFIYGHIIGTIYNYIGIVIGCAIIFHLARMYGPKFVQSMVSQKTYDKYIGWLNEGKRFDRFFIFMMIWPISPADFICMLAGLTNMTFKRYMTIIILCKPITLVIYTYGLTYIIDYFWKMA